MGGENIASRFDELEQQIMAEITLWACEVIQGIAARGFSLRMPCWSSVGYVKL